RSRRPVTSPLMTLYLREWRYGGEGHQGGCDGAAGPCPPRAVAAALPVRLPLDALVVDADGAELAEHRLHEARRGRGARLQCLALVPRGDGRAARVDDAGVAVRDELLEQGFADAALAHVRTET